MQQSPSQLRHIFHFGPIHTDDIAFVLAAGALSVAWFELVKIICVKKKIDLLRG